VEQVGEQPEQERGEQRRAVLHRGELEAGDDAAAVGRRPQEVCGVELRLAEERLGAGVRERDQLTEDDAGGGLAQRPEARELVLALGGDEELDHRAQVLEVDERQAGLVGEVEHQRQARGLRLVEVEHAGQQHRAERRHRRPHRDAGALAAQREELGGEAGRRPLLADARRPGRELVARRSGLRDAGEIALDVGEEHRHAVRGELLGHHLEALGLAGAGGAGDETVAVEHAERDADGDVGQRAVAVQQGAELQRRPLERVPVADRRDDVRLLPTVRLAHGAEPMSCPCA
jgi:hypothetical protein